MTLRVVDLTEPARTDDVVPPGVVVAVGPVADAPEYWLEHATFTLTEDRTDDRRTITVDSVADAVAELSQRCGHWPHASSVCEIGRASCRERV